MTTKIPTHVYKSRELALRVIDTMEEVFMTVDGEASDSEPGNRDPTQRRNPMRQWGWG